MERLVEGMLSNAVAVTVLAVLVAVLGRACRRPALIHSLCLLAFLKLVTPPLVPLAMPLPSAFRPSPAPVPVSVVAEVGAAEFDFDPEVELEAAGVLAYLDANGGGRTPDGPMGGDRPQAAVPPPEWRREPIVLGVMLAGALAWWLLAAVRIVRFHRVLRDVEPMPADWQARIGELAVRLNLRRPPVFCMVPGDVPPMLWAVGVRPRLLVPRQLWATLDEEQRRALVLHELAHLKRRDHWVRWIELVIAGLYWWHPAVWWLRRALREAEEQCCDAWVVWAMPRGAKTYATALVAALEYVSGARHAPAVAAVGNGHVSSLKRRLRMIVRAKTPKGLSLVGRLAVVGLAALLLPLAPSWAQKDTPASASADLEQQLRDARIAVEGSLKAEPGGPEYTLLSTTLLQTDLEMVETQADLEAAQKQLARTNAAKGEPLSESFEAQIEEEFLNAPEAASLVAQMTEAEDELQSIISKVRMDNDPAKLAGERRIRTLKQKWEKLWREQHHEIEQRLLTQKASLRPAVWEEKIVELQAKLEKLKKKKMFLVAQLEKSRGEATPRTEARIAEHLKKDHELAALDREIEAEKKKLAHLKSVSRDFNTDPAGVTFSDHLADLLEKQDSLRASKRAGLLALQKSDDKGDKPKDDKAKDDKGRSTAERIEKQLKDLVEKLGKDASPVGQEVRKALERSVSEIHGALQKDELTAEELRRAVEKSREELRKSFEPNGPVQKEMREAAERARKEMHEAMERGRHEAERVREEMHRQMQGMRDEARQKAQEARERGRLSVEEAQKARAYKAERDRKQAKPQAVPKVEPKPDAGDRSNRAELDAARKQIRDLQQQLESATRRLNDLQKSDARRGDAPARPAEPRAAEPRRPERPARPAEPARPATPAQKAPPARPARPEPPRDNLQPGRDRDDNDRRFRELEDKMNRLLKELQELKGRKTSAVRSLVAS
jgi:bla regulator protein blaR1